MKALVYKGARKVAVETVEEPKIIEPTDCIVKVTTAAICGSDLHLFGGFVPTVNVGDILGHEFMGEIVEVGSEIVKLKTGDRVVIPFPIACGVCWYCTMGLTSLCDTSNKNNEKAQKMFCYPPAGIYGYSHLFGGYQGGQAEYVRVPFAEANAFKVPEALTDNDVLFLGDILPTGYMAAENCEIKKGDTVAVWGAGPVGQFAIQSAFLLGAGNVIVVDSFTERLELASGAGAQTINDTQYKGMDVFDRLLDLTQGRGPESVIDAVGMEAHGTRALAKFFELSDRTKQALMPGMDRGDALREVVYACRKGGTVSVAGAYGGFVDNFPMGIAFNKALNFKMGQTHVHRYMQPLLDKIVDGALKPAKIITHELTLDEAPLGYEMFRNKVDACIKVVLKL